MPPKVSVIVPCYNLGANLDEAVSSVLEQTLQDFEIVVVNDGSTDPDTNRILTGFRSPKARVVQSERRGVAAARNLGIEHSFGEYLCALDADDTLAPTFLQKTAQLLDADDSVAFASCWTRTFGAEERVLEPERCDLATLLGECTVATPALVRRAAVRAVGGYDARTEIRGYEAWDLWISLVEAGYPGVIVPEVLFHRRLRAGTRSEPWTGEDRLASFKGLVAKHDASYRNHLLELLVRKEAVGCEVLKETYALENEVNDLTRSIQARREEIARLEGRSRAGEADGAPEGRVAALERELTESRREAEELRVAVSQARDDVQTVLRTRSWRVTAPLRAAFDLMERISAPRRPASEPLEADTPRLPR